jgi:bacteriocin biosynthesis cyclodehydratase domain-containing protein
VTIMENLTLFSAGAFGTAVAGQIAATVPAVNVLALVAPDESLQARVRGAAFVGVALWRRYPDELDRLDEACAQEGIPWSGVVLEGTKIRCGPVVKRGQGPCYACYRRRWLAHTALPDREEALDAVYAGNLDVGIAGFTSSSVRIAAAALLLDRAEVENAGGRVRWIDLLNCTVEESRAVRVHGCPRCSRPAAPGERYVRELIDAFGKG